MSWIVGTKIFWVTALASCCILAAMTVVGRPLSLAFPASFQRASRLYLSPVLGLAIFTMVSSVLGHFIALGDSIAVPVVVLTLLIVALKFDPARSELAGSVLRTCGFGLVCGLSVLTPLYLFGAFNAHNDAFTYLAHSDWLQRNAFETHIPANQVTPSETQIVLYQRGFRMGSSFVLALFQALLNVRWSIDIYPAVVICTMTSCSLVLGFPVARILEKLSPRVGLTLLALPCFTLGSMVFAANFGFMPQLFGLAFSTGAVVATGALLMCMVGEKLTFGAIVLGACPVAILMAGELFAYPEQAPFVVTAIALGSVFVAARFGIWVDILRFSGILAGLVLALVNLELIRAYISLRIQGGAIVGTPVDWNLLEFIGHAFGLQAGAWDTQRFNVFGAIGGLVLFVFLISNFPSIQWRMVRSEWISFVPALSLLSLFLLGLFYFRYASATPFPTGKGQSWNQFKLMEWASPLASMAMLTVLSASAVGLGPGRRGIILLLVGVAAVGTIASSVQRARSFMDYYKGVGDLSRFYLDLRKSVLANCPLTAPVYLALGRDQKFREMVSLFLFDRELNSDWTDDGYIYHYLSRDRVRVPLAKGDCVIEPIDGSLTTGPSIGPFRIGMFDGRQMFQLDRVDGAYPKESDGRSSWYWVEKEIAVHLASPIELPAKAKITVQFTYLARRGKPLHVTMESDSGAAPVVYQLDSGGSEQIFGQDIAIDRPRELTIHVRSDDDPQPLGRLDPRNVTFMIKDISASAAQ